MTCAACYTHALPSQSKISRSKSKQGAMAPVVEEAEEQEKGKADINGTACRRAFVFTGLCHHIHAVRYLCGYW